MSDSTEIYKLQERIRDRLADVMLLALKEKGGVHLSTDQWYKLKEKLSALLIGEITI